MALGNNSIETRASLNGGGDYEYLRQQLEGLVKLFEAQMNHKYFDWVIEIESN